MGEEHRIVIPSVLERIPDVCDFIVAACRRAGFNERATYHCQMAVDEACTNIIEHGYKAASQSGQIEIVFRDKGDRCAISILDSSPPFNPLEHDDPDPELPLYEREQPGGWGIYFIKKMMDAAMYAYENGRNHLSMVKLKTPENMVQPRSQPVETAITVRPAGDDAWEVVPAARLASNSAPELQDVIDAQLEAGHVHLIVNLGAVSYISTSGLKVLVNAWRHARAQKGNVALVGLNANLHEIFETVGFDQVFDIYDTVDEALQNMRKQAA